MVFFGESMSITLSQLRTESRERADMEHSTFVSDSELNSYINNSISELHDLLIQAYDGDYYIEEATFTTTASTSSYSLSSIITAGDFYKLRGIDAKIIDNSWKTLNPFNFNDRNKYQNSEGCLGLYLLKYRLVGENLVFTPTPDADTEVKVWYVPIAQTLTLDTDSYDDLNNFSEYVIVDAAIKMLQKEESDVSILVSQKKALYNRIEQAANNRDVGQGDSVSDVRNQNANYYWK